MWHRCRASDAERLSARSAGPLLSQQHEELGAGAVREEARCHDADVLSFPQENVPANNDFVFSVTRDCVRGCTTPVLVMPDDTEPHPYAVAEETAMLAPNAQMTFFPWKEAKDRVPLAVRHLRTFLKANTPR